MKTAVLAFLPLLLALPACGDKPDTGSAEGDTDTDTDTDTEGGVNASGTFSGLPVEFHCQPPTDLQVGTYFNHQNPMEGLDVWSFNCQTTDQTIQLWFQVVNPETGRVYQAPTDNQEFYVKLGDPMDIDPLGVYSSNMVEDTVTITAFDFDAGHLAATYQASWSDDGGGRWGDVTGTVDVTGWE